MLAAAGVETAVVAALLQEMLADTAAGWSLGTFGALAEFHHVAADPAPLLRVSSGGGEVVTTTAFTGSTAYNVIVGDADSTNRYLGTTDKTTAARTALVPTGYVSTGQNIRLTVTPTVAAVTAGAITVRVQYVIPGCAHEVVPN